MHGVVDVVVYLQISQGHPQRQGMGLLQFMYKLSISFGPLGDLLGLPSILPSLASCHAQPNKIKALLSGFYGSLYVGYSPRGCPVDLPVSISTAVDRGSPHSALRVLLSGIYSCPVHMGLSVAKEKNKWQGVWGKEVESLIGGNIL